MNVVEIAATFLTVFVLHMHIKYHVLTSNELVLHRMESPPTAKLNRYCDTRQPIVFLAPLVGVDSLKPGITLSNRKLTSNYCNGSFYMAPYGTLVTNHLVTAPSEQIYKDHCYRHYVCALGNNAKVVLWPPTLAEDVPWILENKRLGHCVSESALPTKGSMNLTLKTNEGLFIPSAWAYKITESTGVLHMYYYTPMNLLANVRLRVPRVLPDLFGL